MGGGGRSFNKYFWRQTVAWTDGVCFWYFFVLFATNFFG